MAKKHAEVNFIKQIKPGDKFEISDFQISSSDAEGNLVVADFTYHSDDDEYDTNYEIKPGIWLVDPKTGLSKVTNLSSQQFFETDTSKSLLDHMQKFESKIDVYRKLKQKNIKRSILLASEPGCHAAGQKILMFDGSVKLVEDIVVGDQIMGPDSKPRNVLKLVRGREEMVKIIPRKGEPFIVNKNHIQSFVLSGEKINNAVVNAPISSMLKDSFDKNGQIDRHKIYRSECIDFQPQSTNLPIPPYILGLWLGDGHGHTPSLTSMDKEIYSEWIKYGKSLGLFCRVNTCGRYVDDIYVESKAKTYHLVDEMSSRSVPNTLTEKFREIGLNIGRKGCAKFIPKQYLLSTKEDRLQLLAGIVDTDGNKCSESTIEIITKYEEFANNIAFLARSLGFYVNLKKTQKCATNTVNKTMKDYYRIHISSNLEKLPTRLKRKKFNTRLQIKNPLRTAFKTELLPEDNYYGFTVDGDNLYLLGDFTVTHNCGKSITIRHFLDQNKDREDLCALLVESSDVNWNLITKMFSRVNLEETAVKFVVLIIEDIGGTALNERGSNVDSDMLNFLAGNSECFKIPTLVIGTTNFINELGSTLIDRPGRFDMLIHVAPPKDEEVRLLIEPLIERELTKAEEKALFGKGFTPAYCTEIVIRSMLYDITIEESAKQLEAQREKSRKMLHGKKGGNVGFNNNRDDDDF